MPQPIPTSSPKAAAAVAAQLVNPSEPAPERPDVTDIIADTYNEVMSDPVIRTSHDAAKYILDALEAAGHRPSCRRSTSYDFNSRHPNWDEITQSLAALSTAAQTVELIGRSAVDDIHGQSLVEMFNNLAIDIEDEVGRLKELLKLSEPVRKEMTL